MPIQPRPPAWRAEYASGHEAIDREHQALFAELSGFLSTIHGHEPEVLAAAFDRLVQKCAAHFRCEEALLASLGYPDTDGHARLHSQLLAECNRVRASFQASPEAVLEVMVGRLFETIVFHTVSVDVAFHSHLKTRGIPQGTSA